MAIDMAIDRGNIPVYDMAIQASHHILRIATHGRGMWEIQLAKGP